MNSNDATPARPELCCVPECDRKAVYKTKRLCQRHYFRQWRYGTTELTRVGKRARRFVTPNGYVRVFAAGHPLADATGYVLEHRMVAYDARCGAIDVCERCRLVAVTWRTCHVDHDDGVRRNNDPPNLFVTCVGCNTQRNLARRGVLLTVDGETKNSREWAATAGVTASEATILRRKRSGLSDRVAIWTPGRRKPGTTLRQVKFKNGVRVTP